MTGRIRALVKKELVDVARNKTALIPVGLVSAMALLLPFAIAIGVPAMTGQELADDSDLVNLSRTLAPTADVGPDARVQLFLFQQFLVLFLLIPITSAMALAAHAVIGEKQARTLEPLLATPLTTVELLVAKVLGAFLPTMLISLSGLAVYIGLVAAFARPGVMAALLTMRTIGLVALLGPAAALVSLQLALLVSSRVGDARTAQQFGVLIVLPLTAVLVAQFSGREWLSGPVIVLVGTGLVGVWLVLLALSVAVFARESILIRWR